MSYDKSKHSSAAYRVDYQKYSDNWKRLYGNKKEDESSTQIQPEEKDNKETSEDS